MTETKNWVQRMAKWLLQSLPTRPDSALPPRNHWSFWVQLLKAWESHDPKAAASLPKAKPAPLWPPMSRKRSFEISAFATTGPHSLPGQNREQGPGTKGRSRLPREENPVTWNSANSSQFTPPLGAAILDTHEAPAASQSSRSKGVRGTA